MKYQGFLTLILLMGCGAAPDHDARHAEVVVESEELERAVLRAAGWWHDSTVSEVAFTVVDACSPDRVCVHVHTGELDEGDAGRTAYPLGHPEDCDTIVSDALDSGLFDITLAHELGHVLGLAHDDGVMTADVTHATWALPAEWSDAR